jgi:hypothetical protein
MDASNSRDVNTTGTPALEKGVDKKTSNTTIESAKAEETRQFPAITGTLRKQ